MHILKCAFAIPTHSRKHLRSQLSRTKAIVPVCRIAVHLILRVLGAVHLVHVKPATATGECFTSKAFNVRTISWIPMMQAKRTAPTLKSRTLPLSTQLSIYWGQSFLLYWCGHVNAPKRACVCSRFCRYQSLVNERPMREDVLTTRLLQFQVLEIWRVDFVKLLLRCGLAWTGNLQCCRIFHSVCDTLLLVR